MPEDVEIPKVSKYHSGMFIILRLDALWKDTNRHSRNNQYIKWNNDLDRVWCELSRDLETKDYEKYKKEFKELEDKLNKFAPIIDEIIGFRKPTEKDKQKRRDQYKTLMEKELFLRRLENKLGKGSVWADTDQDAWE